LALVSDIKSFYCANNPFEDVFQYVVSENWKLKQIILQAQYEFLHRAVVTYIDLHHLAAEDT
jgi:hypothetical protein